MSKRSAFSARPRRRRTTLAVTAAAIVAIVALGAWGTGFVWFARLAGSTAVDTESPTDAIVVLTGGSRRLMTGLDLLAADRAEKLFVSGVYRGVDVEQLLRASRQAPAAVECCIVLGYAADDTRGNAAETAAWLRQESYSSVRLVTANYHMPRSLLEFRRALPNAKIVPHPVAPTNVHVEEWWRWPGTTILLVTEYNKYLVALLRGTFA